MIAAALVKAGFQTVLPLAPEFIHNEDGRQKQDCQREAVKRWLDGKAHGYRWLNAVFLADALYSNYPICTAIVEKGTHFIFSCKPDSPRWLYDSIDQGCMKGKTVEKWTAQEHLE